MVRCPGGLGRAEGRRDAGVVRSVIRGGRTLDCHDKHLNWLYAQAGFVETGRMRFNDEYASPKWDYKTFDRPEVVFMAWKGWPGGDKQAALEHARGAARRVAPAPAHVPLLRQLGRGQSGRPRSSGF